MCLPRTSAWRHRGEPVDEHCGEVCSASVVTVVAAGAAKEAKQGTHLRRDGHGQSARSRRTAFPRRRSRRQNPQSPLLRSRRSRGATAAGGDRTYNLCWRGAGGRGQGGGREPQQLGAPASQPAARPLAPSKPVRDARKPGVGSTSIGKPARSSLWAHPTRAAFIIGARLTLLSPPLTFHSPWTSHPSRRLDLDGAISFGRLCLRLDSLSSNQELKLVTVLRIMAIYKLLVTLLEL